MNSVTYEDLSLSSKSNLAITQHQNSKTEFGLKYVNKSKSRVRNIYLKIEIFVVLIRVYDFCSSYS